MVIAVQECHSAQEVRALAAKRRFGYGVIDPTKALEARLNTATAERDRIKQERDRFKQERDQYRASAERLAETNSILNARLTGANYTLDAEPNNKFSIEKIIRVICEYYAVTRVSLLSHKRDQDIVRPRQVAMYLSREYSGKATPVIGRKFGDRDHTTVLHAHTRIRVLRELNPDVDNDVTKIISQLSVGVASQSNSEAAPCPTPAT